MGAPGDCGSWATGAKLEGYRSHTRRISSFWCWDQNLEVCSLPMWWPIQLARGEKIVRSVPRSRWKASWAPSRLSRISSSLTRISPLDPTWFGSEATAAFWASRHSPTAGGVVV